MNCRTVAWTVAWTVAIVSLGGVCPLRAAESTQPAWPGIEDSVMDRLYRDRLEAESAEVLSITLFDASLDPASIHDPQLYQIISDGDPAYARDKQVRPASVSVRRRVVRLSERHDLMLKPTVIFLALPAAMTQGCRYRVSADRAHAGISPLAAVTFDDAHQVNDNIRVNHLGYLPGYAKRAYVGQYLGDGGAMPIKARSFQLVDAGGKVRFSGVLTRRKQGEEFVGQEVWEADFSAVDGPGTFRVRVPGLGVSHPFAITADAYNPAYANLMRGNYHQRCGADIPAGWSRFARPACHLDDALVDPAAAKLPFVAPKSPPLYESDLTVKQRTATRGHHDAGDYGKYTISGAAYVFSILHAFEVFPDRFQEDNLGLPCSGNGIPDLLDEAKWELDWLENMQDSDGGVFGVIRPKNGGYENHLPPAKSGRLMFPKDTVFTAAYAAALAKAARSPAVTRHYPDDAPRYLRKARAAWAWLEKNQRYTEYFHYGAVFGDRDERCWAAVELFQATGEPQFRDYVKAHFDPALKRWDWWALFEAQGYAVHSLVAGPRALDDDLLARAKEELRKTCERLVAYAAAQPYRLSFPQESLPHKRYGWFFPGEMAGYHLLMGHKAFGEARYLQCALDNLGYTMGANPAGYFLFTGLGHKRNIEIVHDPSKHDDIIEPSPGIPLGIGSDGIYYLNRYGKTAGEGQHPNEWPLLNRWYDGFNVTSEFTTPQLAKETVVAAYFAAMPKTKPAPPSIAIRATAEKTAAKKTSAGASMQFELDAKPGGGEIRQVFWDFDDESFSTAPRPTHLFADAGRRHRVAATVVDANGQWAWATTTVTVPLERPAYRRKPHVRDAGTIAQFPLDGDFDDNGKRGLRLAVKEGGVYRPPYRFEEGAASWMTVPRGRTLVMHGNEQFTVELPPDAAKALYDKGLYVEAMLYIDDFTAFGFPGDPLLFGLHQKWNSWAGLKQGTWDRKLAPAFLGAGGAMLPVEETIRGLPRRRWCQLRLEFSPQNGCVALLDGTALGKPAKFAFQPAGRDPLILSVGPWRGMVNDIVVGRLE
jgi:hypothetical protein